MKIPEFSVKKPRIEMMPLIDSFFLILVYFIYAFLSMSVHRGMELNLPTAQTATQQNQDYFAISITAGGDLFFNKDPVTVEQLDTRLRTAKQMIEETGLFVFGDTESPHGQLVKVLDTARGMGISKVFIETNPEAIQEEIRKHV